MSELKPREGYLLFIVGTKLRWIASQLELCPATIDDAKEMQWVVREAELIAETLSAELAIEARCLLTELRASIGQCDVPAQCAALDSDDEEAQRICTEAFHQTDAKYGSEARRISARCVTIAGDAFSGMNIAALDSLLGFSAKDVPKADYWDLQEMLFGKQPEGTNGDLIGNLAAAVETYTKSGRTPAIEQYLGKQDASKKEKDRVYSAIRRELEKTKKRLKKDSCNNPKGKP